MAFRQDLSDYWTLLAGHRGQAIAAALALATSGGLEALALLLLNPILGGGSPIHLIAYKTSYALAGFAFCGLAATGLRFASQAALLWIGARVEERLRREQTRALFQMSWSRFLALRIGDINQGTLGETRQIALGVTGLIAAFGQALTCVLFLFAALALSWKMTLVTVAFAGAIALVYRTAGQRAAYHAGVIASLGATINERVIELFGNLKYLKATGLTGKGLEQLESAFDRFTLSSLKNQAYGPLSAFLTEAAGIVFIVCFLMWAIFVERMRAPETIVLLAVFYRLVPRVTLLQGALYQVRQLQPWYDRWRDRQAQILRGKDADHGSLPPSLRPTVELEGVSVTYPGAERPAIRELRLRLPFGACVALVGSSGSGKSTVIDLVTGLLSPGEGAVRIDGRPMAEVDLELWRLGIGLVLQDTPLFDGTLLDNIAWGDPAPDGERARECAEQAGAWAFIAQLPLGLDAPVGERGALLSGGQRQRLAIARALYRRPHLLILDEATSALDSETERRVLDGLRSLKGRMTILMVAHRLQTARWADEIVVLDGGVVVERGAWVALAAHEQGRFHALLRLQEGQA